MRRLGLLLMVAIFVLSVVSFASALSPVCGCYPNGTECFLYQGGGCPSECNVDNCITNPSFSMVSIQGKVINRGGAPLNANITMKFEFYNTSDGGTPFYSFQSVEPVRDGFFKVSIPVPGDIKKVMSLYPTYIQVYIGNEKLSPRLQYTSSLYSVYSEYLGQYKSSDFVKRYGDSMFGPLLMNWNDIKGIRNMFGSFAEFNFFFVKPPGWINMNNMSILHGNGAYFREYYEGGVPIREKYVFRNQTFIMGTNIWCNNINDCYAATDPVYPTDIVYGRIGLGNFGAGETKMGTFKFPYTLRTTPIIVATLESCEGIFAVNVHSPSKTGFSFRVKNLENYSTSCSGGIFLNFIALTRGGSVVNATNGASITSWPPQQNVYYRDADNDGYGDPNQYTTSDSQPAGYVSDNTDCDDSNQNIHPGATEVCNGIDDDCDGLVDEGVTCYYTYYRDADNDGYGDPNQYTTSDSQPAGYVSDNTDCDDSDPDIHPGALELCNGIDDDCDGLVDTPYCVE